MAVLIVVEGGEKRGFRMSSGRLTVGTGESAGLKLESPDVAAEHADLELEDGQLFVVPRPGVVPPKVQGVDVKARTRLGRGQELRIGKAKIQWRPEEDDVEAASRAPKGAVRAKPGPTPKEPAVRRRSVVKSRGRQRSSGTPAWIPVLIVLAVVGGGGYVVLQQFSSNLEAAASDSASSRLAKAEELIDIGNIEAAQAHVDAIAPASLDAGQVTRLDALEVEIERQRAAREVRRHNERGNAWFENKLERYEERYLSDGEPELPKVRVFLERSAEFRERWPEHPELAWVDRQERRFAGFPGLSRDPDFEDVDWEVKVHLSVDPSDYASALATLHAFREGMSAREAVAVDSLIAELERDRKAEHDANLREAEERFDAGMTAKAFEHLVKWIQRAGDPEMAEDAARVLVRFPDAAALLRGYRDERTEDFEAIVENDVVRRFVEQEL